MKTKNKIISIIMSLCLVLLSGCSQESGGETVTDAETAAKTSAAENGNNDSSADRNAEDDTAEESSEEEAEAETTAEEAEELSADERFAYYDLLSEEYAKYGKLYQLNSSGWTYIDSMTYIKNGKAIFSTISASTYDADDYNIRIYDCKAKSDIADFLFTTAHNDYDYNRYPANFYADVDGGYIYCLPNKGFGGTLYKYDTDGKLISQLDTAEEERMNLLFADGTFITYVGYSEEEKCYLYSEDWKTKKEIPPVQIDVGHGITKDIYEYNILTKYKNKIYAYVSDSEGKGFYCLNTDTGIWEYDESELQNIAYSVGYYEYYYEYYNQLSTIGRYFLIGSAGVNDENGTRGTVIYDMETGKIIAVASDSYFSSDYAGEKAGLSFNFEGQVIDSLYRYRYPSDGSEAEKETLMEEVTFEGEAVPIGAYYDGPYAHPVDEECYLFRDKYGVFLRTFDGEETTVMLFEE